MKDLSNLKKSMIDFRKERAEKRAADLDLSQKKNPDLVGKVTAGLYSKGLEHNVTTGLASQEDIDKIILALETGEQSDFDSIPESTVSTRKQESPQAALSFSASGGEPEGFAIEQSYALNSRKAAADMLEVYERNILRDIPFNVISGDVAGTAQQETDLTRAIDTLNSFGADFTGPKVGGVVTRKSLFRGKGANELVGPYMSQFLLHDIPIGQHTITQQAITETGQYGITNANFIAIQNGSVPVAQTKGAAQYAFSPRVLGSFVHIDFVYQAHLYAAALLLGAGVARNEAFPVLSKESNFVNSSGPADIAAAIGEISRHALKATWVQKWRKHLKLRPEAMAGRIVKEEEGNLPAGTVHPEIFTLGADTIAAVKAQNLANGGEEKAFLPLQFAEGSPMHPSANAGHAGIAGACSALLKMYFKDGPWSGTGISTTVGMSDINTVQSVDGSVLSEYTEADASQMTVHGEIDKLASNMALGRDFAGVHYRYDGDEGILLGERVAIQWMIDNAAQSNVNIGTIRFTSADGVTPIEVKTN